MSSLSQKWSSEALNHHIIKNPSPQTCFPSERPLQSAVSSERCSLTGGSARTTHLSVRLHAAPPHTVRGAVERDIRSFSLAPLCWHGSNTSKKTVSLIDFSAVWTVQSLSRCFWVSSFKLNLFVSSDKLCFIQPGVKSVSRTRTAQSAGLNVIGSRFCNPCDANITCLLPDIHQEVVELQVRKWLQVWMVICKCDTAGYFERDGEISSRVCGDKNEVF